MEPEGSRAYFRWVVEGVRGAGRLAGQVSC